MRYAALLIVLFAGCPEGSDINGGDTNTLRDTRRVDVCTDRDRDNVCVPMDCNDADPRISRLNSLGQCEEEPASDQCRSEQCVYRYFGQANDDMLWVGSFFTERVFGSSEAPKENIQAMWSICGQVKHLLCFATTTEQRCVQYDNNEVYDENSWTSTPWTAYRATRPEFEVPTFAIATPAGFNPFESRILLSAVSSWSAFSHDYDQSGVPENVEFVSGSGEPDSEGADPRGDHNTEWGVSRTMGESPPSSAEDVVADWIEIDSQIGRWFVLTKQGKVHSFDATNFGPGTWVEEQDERFAALESIDSGVTSRVVAATQICGSGDLLLVVDPR